MEKELTEIKKGISDLKLSIIIGLLVAFIVSSVFVWGIMISKMNKISIVLEDVDNKTIDLSKIAD